MGSRRITPEVFWSRVKKAGPDECWDWIGYIAEDGYGSLTIKRKSVRAHRVAYAWTFGPIPDGMVCRHACDRPVCCNPAHLLLGTHGENIADRGARNRTARGEKHGRTKLTAKEVMDIRAAARSGEPHPAIASRYGVHKSSVWSIASGRNWKHLQAQP